MMGPLKPGESPHDRLLALTRKKHKYSARRTGRYASKAEAKYAAELKWRKESGDVLDWIEQVRIRLTDDDVYVCDFIVFYRNGNWALVECKGFETREWRRKKKLLEKYRPELFNSLIIVR